MLHGWAPVFSTGMCVPQQCSWQDVHALGRALRAAAAGNRLKSAQAALPRKSRFSSKADEARDILANLIICHVPCVHFDFGPKVSGCRRKLGTYCSSAGPCGGLLSTPSLPLWSATAWAGWLCTHTSVGVQD